MNTLSTFGTPESNEQLAADQRISGLRSRYRYFDEFNERDQTKLFQVMGLLGFFRRKGLPELGFESAMVMLLVAQRQSEGKTTTHAQWQTILGLKGDAAARVALELGFAMKPVRSGKNADRGDTHALTIPAHGLLQLLGSGDEHTELQLTASGKKVIEDLTRLSVFKD
ncbi:hypothetical protein NQT62_13935 [Limnobacter humi]|uniref:MarR family transcriptional regulator n=1 Tax=Limnobacter humi TaxID=1778671 RepID=A0ABT1WJ51_9BURK|nr:hypothetical protein [Limnobacter humi]MCQ8897537.1 hypothetical protein [Limnobacter humi]